MKKYSMFQVPLLSFFSKDLYRYVCKQWKVLGFAYLLLLLAVCWIPTVVKINTLVTDVIDNDVPVIIQQIPTITIVDGKASIEESQPYYIRYPTIKSPIVVLDTTGKIISLEDTDAWALLTKTDFIIKESEVETRTLSLNEITEFTLNQEKIQVWVDTTKKFFAPTIYLSALLVSFVARIIQVLIYAVIGLLFASWCKSKRTYIELISLAIVAVTPGIIIKTILTMLSLKLPSAGLWYFLAAMGYLFFGIKAASVEEVPPQII